jgi:hypothetical protein
MVWLLVKGLVAFAFNEDSMVPPRHGDFRAQRVPKVVGQVFLKYGSWRGLERFQYRFHHNNRVASDLDMIAVQ